LTAGSRVAGTDQGTATQTTDDRPYSTLGVDGEVYVYDTEQETAWIQSDAGVEAGARR
jgi:hypothetical protein